MPHRSLDEIQSAARSQELSVHRFDETWPISRPKPKKLAPWCPGVILPTLAWGVTIAEFVLGLLLIVGLWRKPTAVLAALLTLSFALSMTVVLGPHDPLNYSVFVFAFAS